MKKLMIMLAGVILPLAFFAQDTPFSKVYEEYVGKQGYYSHEVIPSQMSMEWESEMETDAIREVMNKVTAFRMLSTDAEEGGSRKKLEKSISDAVSRADYTELMTVMTDDESIHMYGLKLDEGSMREFVLTIMEKDEVTLITLTGDMDMSDIIKEDLMGEVMKVGEKYKGKKECPKEF
jgi:hypothetical protein